MITKHAANDSDAEDDRKVVRLDRIDRIGADAGDREDLLGDDRPAQQQPEVQPVHRDDRREGATQLVPDHPPLLEALGLRRADVVLALDLQHVASNHPRVEGGADDGEDHPRKPHDLEPLDRVLE